MDIILVVIASALAAMVCGALGGLLAVVWLERDKGTEAIVDPDGRQARPRGALGGVVHLGMRG